VSRQGLPNFMPIDHTVQEIWPFFDFFFKMAAVRHLGFCFTRDWTAHEAYLVVFVTVQNLVAIGAVISIGCKF